MAAEQRLSTAPSTPATAWALRHLAAPQAQDHCSLLFVPVLGSPISFTQSRQAFYRKDLPQADISTDSWASGQGAHLLGQQSPTNWGAGFNLSALESRRQTPKCQQAHAPP